MEGGREVEQIAPYVAAKVGTGWAGLGWATYGT